jgi:hypothetical protein
MRYSVDERSYTVDVQRVRRCTRCLVCVCAHHTTLPPPTSSLVWITRYFRRGKLVVAFIVTPVKASYNILRVHLSYAPGCHLLHDESTYNGEKLLRAQQSFDIIKIKATFFTTRSQNLLVPPKCIVSVIEIEAKENFLWFKKIWHKNFIN